LRRKLTEACEAAVPGVQVQQGRYCLTFSGLKGQGARVNLGPYHYSADFEEIDVTPVVKRGDQLFVFNSEAECWEETFSVSQRIESARAKCPFFSDLVALVKAWAGR